MVNKINPKKITIDGNTAAASIAYAFSDVAAIYPITPASPMGELADVMSAQNQKNIFNMPVKIQEMQSEAGAAGTVHGALTAGALTTTFTASQGLLLMLPNMFKIAGEMMPTVFHIAARSLACQALSIYADHSDVMAVRGTGFAMIASSNVQEAQDMAAIAHLSTLPSKVPFLHFFDGFRTSHEIQKIDALEQETIKEMIDMKAVRAFKDEALRPEKPFAKVGAEGPGVYFQGRETVNKYYDKTPKIVKKYMDLFFEKTGRRYNLFEYIGAKDATKIIIAMGSATDTIDETIEYLTSQGEKVGCIKVRLYRPFSVEDFISVMPKTVKKIAVLDRTKEPGSIGEPLYLDIVSALRKPEFRDIEIIGGRYGLSSKEFTPSMVKAVFGHLENNGHHGFTVGINDDVTNLSIDVKEEIDSSPKDVYTAKFWGYGSDGTVSATKNTIKIVGNNTNKHVQANFQYDAKKSGGVTRSYIRFQDDLIKSTYTPTKLNYIALHKPSYIGKYDILAGLKTEGTFLLNTTRSPQDAFYSLTKSMQQTIIDKKIKFYVIDAFKISKKNDMGTVISTIMQTAFFKISGVLPEDQSIEYVKKFVEKQFMKKGQEVIDKNFAMIDQTLENLHLADVPTKISRFVEMKKLIPDQASDFVKNIVKPCMVFESNQIPVSQMTLNGAIPTGITKVEKRGVTLIAPKWLNDKCIQCGQCVMVCPNSAIRMKQIKSSDLENAPEGFVFQDSKTQNDKDLKFRIQVYPEDCVGCNLCANTCPVNDLEMIDIEKVRESGENQRAEFFDKLPDITSGVNEFTVKGLQFKQPLIEFTSSCPGCGEVAYVKTLTQMYGDNLMIANATGCSSIWGGTFPAIPYTTNSEGKGPAWANSLFEDNAEYGLGFKLAVEATRAKLKQDIEILFETGTTVELENALKEMLEVWDKTDSLAREKSKAVLDELPKALDCVYGESAEVLKRIDENKDYLLNKSVWIIGGDGWAYDIGYGGLDHVLAQGKNINVLVMDTEVYSNTGGQASKATPIGSSAKFASKGKETAKKNLGLMMMSYGNVYVASVSLGANKQQLITALKEAEEYDGPSIVIAYSPCIAHGTDMHKSTQTMKEAVESGYWPMYRYDPRLREEGKSPLVWESTAPKEEFIDFIKEEGRYKSVELADQKRAKELFIKSQQDAKRRREDLEHFEEFLKDKTQG